MCFLPTVITTTSSFFSSLGTDITPRTDISAGDFCIWYVVSRVIVLSPHSL